MPCPIDMTDALLFWMNSSINFVLSQALQRIPKSDEVKVVLGSIVDEVKAGRRGKPESLEDEYFAMIAATLKWVKDNTGVEVK